MNLKNNQFKGKIIKYSNYEKRIKMDELNNKIEE